MSQRLGWRKDGIIDYKKIDSVRLGDEGQENCKMVHRFLKCKAGWPLHQYGNTEGRRYGEGDDELMPWCTGVFSDN